MILPPPIFLYIAFIAQSVERAAVNRKVTGSIPVESVILRLFYFTLILFYTILCYKILYKILTLCLLEAKVAVIEKARVV